MRATHPTRPSQSIAAYPFIGSSDSLFRIFGFVPDPISAWNPEMAPQAMVMKTNGKSLPGMIGPPPAANCDTAGAEMGGATMMVPVTSEAIVPSFMYDER